MIDLGDNDADLARVYVEREVFNATVALLTDWTRGHGVQVPEPARIVDVAGVLYNGLLALRTPGSAKATLRLAPKSGPAVDPKKSVTDDFIISLEDGKPYKMLRRHLAKRGMTPEDYRAKWGLPESYPMTAPSYSVHRSQMAKDLGLGKKR